MCHWAGRGLGCILNEDECWPSPFKLHSRKVERGHFYLTLLPLTEHPPNTSFKSGRSHWPLLCDRIKPWAWVNGRVAATGSMWLGAWSAHRCAISVPAAMIRLPWTITPASPGLQLVSNKNKDFFKNPKGCHTYRHLSKCLELGCFSKRCIRCRKLDFCLILPRDLRFLYSECGNCFLRAAVLGQPDWQHCIYSKVNLTRLLRPNNALFKAQTAEDGTILYWVTAELQIFTVCWGFTLELLSDNSTNMHLNCGK